MKIKRPDAVWNAPVLLMMAFLFINLAFPKAGTKIGNFPLYLSVGVSYLAVLPLLVAKLIKKTDGRTERTLLLYFFFLAITLAVNAVFFLFTGNFTSPDPGYLMAYTLALGSILFTLVFRYYTPEQVKFREILIASFVLITVYGFIQKIFGDVRVIIPGLTMNYSDYSHIPWWWDKSNFVPTLRYIKLSSTYQNGNLFGVNYILISWFTLYFLDQGKARLNRIVFFLALAAYTAICLLTFSGTVYIGLIVTLLLYYLYRMAGIYRGKDVRRRLKLTLAVAIPAALLTAAVLLFNWIPQLAFLKGALVDRLLNRDLIGNERIKNFLPYLGYLWDNKLFFQFFLGSLMDMKRAGSSYEITLATVFFNSGILFTGFFAYVVFLFIRKWKFELFSIGLFTYLLITLVDGAFWLPPTPVVFFTLAGAGVCLSENRKRSFD